MKQLIASGDLKKLPAQSKDKDAFALRIGACPDQSLVDHFDCSFLPNDIKRCKIKFHGNPALSFVFVGAEEQLLQEADESGCELMLSKLDQLMSDAKLRKVGVHWGCDCMP